MKSLKKLHVLLIVVYAITSIFLKGFVPGLYQQSYNTYTAVLGALLIIASLYFILTDKETQSLKSYDKLVSKENSSAYLQIWFLLFITDLDSIAPIGSIFYITVTLIILIYCIWVVAKDAFTNRSIVSGVIIGHCLLGYLMFSYGKGAYTRNYGDEVIGSFFEKAEYKAKYIVKVYRQGDEEDFFLLPAQLHVYSKDYEFDDGESIETSTQRFIMAERIYFNNGGHLRFNDCNLIDGKVYCIDQNSIGWYIELTDRKIK